MKVIAILAVVCALVVYAEEEQPGKFVQLCGAELAAAVKHVCEDGDLEFLNSQEVQHNHQHNHQHDVHDHHKGHAMKRDSTSVLADMCCSKPCHIKDFISACP